MANYMDSPAKQDNDGITYIFGSYDKEERWNFSPFYFRLINTERNKISGQFISSNWFISFLGCDSYRYLHQVFLIKNFQKN